MAEGTIVGPYRISGVLGAGAMGTVYRAIHILLKREVALKVITNQGTCSADAGVRFRREMRLMSGLNHRNLVMVFDGDVAGEFPYIAMELIPGPPLSTLLTAGALPWQRALRIASQLAEALEHLHAHRILHRDLKPANVLVAPDEVVKLVDFGVSRTLEGTVVTPVGVMVGTPRFWAPELFEGEDASPATDVWALGCILFEMLTGQPPIPIRIASVGELIVATKRCGTLDPRRERPAIPPGVARVAQSLLAVSAKDRLGPAGDVASLLASMLNSEHLARTWRTRPSANTSANATDFTESPAVLDPSVPPVPAQAAFRGPGAKVWIALALVSLLVGRGFDFQSRRGGHRPPSLESAIPRPPTPRPPDREEIRPTLWNGWRKCQQLLPLSKDRKGWSRENGAKLQQMFGLPLGSSIEPWIHWVQLGRWLDGRAEGRPPAYAHAFDGTFEVEQMVEGDVSEACQGTVADRLAESLKLAGTYPQEGRSWLTLSAALRLDGDEAEARLVDRVFLAYLDNIFMKGSPRTVWAAVVRAMVSLGGDRLERQWIRLVEQDGDEIIPWLALGDVLSGGGGGFSTVGESKASPRFRRLLDRGRQSPKACDGATEYLGQSLFVERRNRELYRLWADHLRHHPAARKIRYRLADELIVAARIDEVPDLVKVLSEDDFHFRILNILTSPVGQCEHLPRGTYGSDTWIRTGRAVAMALLQAGRTTEAEEILRDPPLRDCPEWLAEIVPCELAGAGCRSPWVLAKCQQLIHKRLPPYDSFCRWDAVIGALAPPGSTALFASLFSKETVAEFRLSEPLVRGLRLSRMGRLEEAARVLPTDDGKSVCDDCPLWALEIAARPLWQALLTGKRAAPPLVVRRWMRSDPQIQKYLEYLSAGRLGAEAAEIAQQESEVFARPSVWGLALAYQAAINRNRAEFHRWYRGLTAQIRWFGYGSWLQRDLDLLKSAVDRERE